MTTRLLDKTAPPVQLQTDAAALTKGERTRERLLDLAYEAVMAKGFAATCIEELVEAAGITKSGFFYHFRDKNDLARQMLERYLAGQAAVTDGLAARARELTDDPLHSYLVFLRLYAEELTGVATRLPGCLVATVAFQEKAFAAEVARLNSDGVRRWREDAASWLHRIAERYPPRAPVDLDALADAFIAIGIGGLALSKATGEPQAMGRQLLAYRELVRLLFSPE
jgi:AcrR family transcriptional regulator